jgi:hypothetical protein
MATISRTDLFEEVWTRPLSAIAPEYGLSDVGLRKICDRADIPTPGRGYWAKVTAGQALPRPKFRPAKNPDFETVYIHGSPQPSPRVVETLERVRTARTTKAKAAAEVKAEEPAQGGEGCIAEQTELHRLAKATVAKIAAATKPGLVHVSGKGLFTVAVTAEHGERIGQILTLLLTAIEEMGWHAENAEKSLLIVPDGEPLAFSIAEQTDKVKHELVPPEAAALARHEEARKRAERRGEWFSDWDRPKIAEWDYVPNGLLALSLETGLYRSDRIRRNFSDGKTQRIEGLIDRVIDSLAAYAASEKARRERQEQARLAAIDAQKRREEAQRRHELENKRVEFLNAQLTRLKRAREIESFVDEIEKQGEPPVEVRALLDWANEWAGELREAISHETLRSKIERVDLMNDDARIHSWVKVDGDAS